jgi:hypothetical protein
LELLREYLTFDEMKRNYTNNGWHAIPSMG